MVETPPRVMGLNALFYPGGGPFQVVNGLFVQVRKPGH